MKDILHSAYFLLVCYILAAFINWEINAGNWSEFARLNVVLVWLFLNFAWFLHKADK